jgi:hypothetical protein
MLVVIALASDNHLVQADILESAAVKQNNSQKGDSSSSIIQLPMQLDSFLSLAVRCGVNTCTRGGKEVQVM